jgi:hypothetical protein
VYVFIDKTVVLELSEVTSKLFNGRANVVFSCAADPIVTNASNFDH